MAAPLHRRRPLVVAAAGIAALASSACADFDREDRIEDLRVLAIRTEPAEILYHPFYALLPPADRPPFLTLPSYDVDVEVYAYDPRGGEIVSTTQLCPQGHGACLDFDVQDVLVREPEAASDELRALHELREVESEILPGRERGDPTGRIEGLRTTYSLTPPVMDSLIPNTAEGQPIPSFFPELPLFVADVQNASVAEVPRETAYKRLPVSLDVAHPDLPDGFLDTFGQILGIRYCAAVIPDEDFVEGRTECVEPRGPNLNPRLLGFDLDDDDALEGLVDEPIRFAEMSDLGPSSRLSVPRGGHVNLTPVFPPGDRQHYQVLSFDVETSALFIDNRWEDYVVNWYTTRGDVVPPLSTVQLGSRLGVTWQLPNDGVESGELDTIVAVVRDQRGGVTVGRVVVEYR